MINEMDEALGIAGNCRHYAMCKIDFLGTGICASGVEHGYVSFYPEGRMDLYAALAKGRVPVTEKCVEIAQDCDLCGKCDYPCCFVTGLRPTRVMEALKSHVARHLAAGKPVAQADADPCASDTRFSERSRREATETNVHALPGIIRMAKDSGARCFHYVSTAYVSGSGPAREAPVVSRMFPNVYEETKAEAERQVAARCSLQATPFTIVRPSIVYGDSVTGRSNRFNALYYHVRALGLIRDIYLNDLSHHGGRKSREIGVHLEPDGILHLPLRIFLARRGHVNLIPVDYFVAVMMSVLESPRSGHIYHITSDAPRTTEELAAYCERFLGIRGIETVYGEGPNGGVQNPPEEIFNKLVRPYLPYLSDTRSFDRTNTKSLAARLSAPDLTYDVFERCMRYAVHVGWGNADGMKGAGISRVSGRGETKRRRQKMAASTGRQLAETIHTRIEELKKVCEGIDEGTASRAPQGRWSPKQILSHVLGPEGPGITEGLQGILELDVPTIDLEAENPFFTERRALMRFDELLSEVEKQYGEVSKFAEGLSPDQLDRKAHVPLLKETDLGEYPTLEGMIGGLLDYHLQFHTGHMREILEALQAS